MMRDGYEFSDSLSDRVADFINARSMLGCTFDIAEYTKQPINISAKLYVNSNYDPNLLKDYAERYLKEVTFRYGEKQFDDSIVKSDLEMEIIETFAGIISFRINEPEIDIISPLEPNNVLTLGEVEIEVELVDEDSL